MSRSRSPAPAMIPRALVSGTFHDAHVLMRDAHTLDDAGEDDSMPPLYDEYTDQVLPHGSLGEVRHGTHLHPDAVSTYAEISHRGGM